MDYSEDLGREAGKLVLELVNLTKTFLGFTLGPLNLKIDDNEILVMIGPTGSGKTTVLNLIAGLLKPDSGINSNGWIRYN